MQYYDDDTNNLVLVLLGTSHTDPQCNHIARCRSPQILSQRIANLHERCGERAGELILRAHATPPSDLNLISEVCGYSTGQHVASVAQ